MHLPTFIGSRRPDATPHITWEATELGRISGEGVHLEVLFDGYLNSCGALFIGRIYQSILVQPTKGLLTV